MIYLGQIMEHGSVERIFENPLHPYTRALWRSIPTVDGALERLQPIEGALPDPFELHAGCPFLSRCHLRVSGVCDRIPPPLVEVEPGHEVRCILYDEAG